ncbi:MAG: sulfite exporter TauE/SafE family protein [Actinomycetota bacterium]
MPELLTALLLGAAAGVLSGMFGIGGGVVIVPALVLVMGFSQREATGTSLMALVLPVGLLAVIAYARAGDVNVRFGLVMAAGIFVGALGGARIGLGTSELVMRRAFAVVLLALAVRLAFVKA